MQRSLEDFIDQTMKATTPAEVWRLFREAAQAEGYENVVSVKTRNGLLYKIVWADLPEHYAPAYQHNNWDRIDPVLKRAQSSVQPFLWFDAAPPATSSREIRNFFEECRGLGVHSGLTIPLHGPSNELDLISLSVREKEEPPRERTPVVYAMALQAWLRKGQLDESQAASCEQLSAREIACLSWMRDGKTNVDIGDILGISEKTVQFHVKNIFRKLGVSSRIEAVVAGLRAGVIVL